MSFLKSLSLAAAGITLAAGMTTAVVAQDLPTVALVLHGNLGDKSFFDSAAAGVNQAAADLGIEIKIIEAGYEPSKWEPALLDAADQGYDIVIAGTFAMIDYVVKAAPDYPDQKFITFDTTPDFAACECSNVLGVMYQTSSAGYLAGYAAGKLSTSGILGTIIGADFPTVTDFKVGFDQGAKAANPDIQILNADAGGVFNDPAKGKEMALAQLGQGADVIFPIAGSTGIGALQAVKDAGKLAVGVDSDQALMFAATDPAQAAVIFTSVEKKVGQSLYLAIKGTVEGTQEYGKFVLLGLADGAVGISKNEYWEKLVPAEVRAEVDELEKKIASGEIVVDTVM